MSNAVYPKGLDAMGSALVNYASDDIYIQLLNGSYGYVSTHETTSDLSGLVGDATLLTGKSLVDGEFFAADVVIPAVPAGDTVLSFVIYDATSDKLLAYADTRSDTAPISIITSDGDITITWSSGRVFKI